jgi:hypothetical protein
VVIPFRSLHFDLNLNDLSVQVTSVFTIRNVLYEDQGRYRCTATNTLTGGIERSVASVFAEITVTRKWK